MLNELNNNESEVQNESDATNKEMERLKQQKKNSDQCTLPRNDNNFEVAYRFLASDWIRANISTDVLSHMSQIFYDKNEHETKELFMKIIKNFPKIDNAGLGGSIQESDYDTIINVIIAHFIEIMIFWETELLKKEGVLIVTNRNYSWDRNDSMGVWKQR